MLESKISTREKDGKIQAIVSFKVNGKWQQKTKQGFTTEKDARRWAADTEFALQKEIRSGVVYSDMTLGEVRAMFLEFKKLEGKTPKTMDTYEKTTAALEPFFDKPIRKITEYELTEFFLRKRMQTGKSYHEHQRMARVLFSFAANTLQVIARNPVKVLKSTHTDKRKKYVESADLAAILSQEMPKVVRLSIRLIAETGCRTGEAFGITIHDLRPGEVTINKQMSKTHTLAPLKNKEKGTRVCPISDRLYSGLIAYYKTKSEQALDGRIFEKRIDINRYFQNSGTSAHCLRHTHATDLVAMGINPVEAAALIGDTYQTFANTYVHSSNAEREKAVATIRQMKLKNAN